MTQTKLCSKECRQRNFGTKIPMHTDLSIHMWNRLFRLCVSGRNVAQSRHLRLIKVVGRQPMLAVSSMVQSILCNCAAPFLRPSRQFFCKAAGSASVIASTATLGSSARTVVIILPGSMLNFFAQSARFLGR